MSELCNRDRCNTRAICLDVRQQVPTALSATDCANTRGLILGCDLRAHTRIFDMFQHPQFALFSHVSAHTMGVSEETPSHVSWVSPKRHPRCFYVVSDIRNHIETCARLEITHMT